MARNRNRRGQRDRDEANIVISILAFILVLVVASRLNKGEAVIASQDASTTSSPLYPVLGTTPKDVTPKPTSRSSKTVTKEDCPTDCKCTETKIDCDRGNISVMSDFSKYTYVTEISLRDNSISSVNFAYLPLASLQRLDLSSNTIKSLSNTTKKINEFPRLIELNLSNNSLDNLTKFSNWKFPSLEILDLSHNDLVELQQFSFNKTGQLKELNLTGNLNIRSIHENVFWPLTQLSNLNLSNLENPPHLGDKQFVKNQELKILDLSYNSLIEVPVALRGTNSIEKLILNDNLMTSLRPSDFVNQSNLVYLEITGCKNLTKVDDFAFRNMPNLRQLILANNPSLNSISREAFHSSGGQQTRLQLLDLRGNNLSTLSNPSEFPSLKLYEIFLQDNPWDCNCASFRWVQNITDHSTLHCKTPARYRDMSVDVFFTTTDCDVVESDYHSIIVTGFILFLLGLFVAILLQRNERWRRLFWKDQYGTIYYTKASFPQEGV